LLKEGKKRKKKKKERKEKQGEPVMIDEIEEEGGPRGK
jgi:hypothetical protein